MTATLLDSALGAAQAVRTAGGGGAFDRSVREFVEILRRIPDYPASALSTETTDVLIDQAEDVIRHIETRLAAGGDRMKIQRDLAEAVYDVRKALEDINIWRRHHTRH
jgi:hypothetical protein